MCIKFNFLLKALHIEENTLRKREIKKDKEERENWIKISITYKYRLISLEEYSIYSLTKDYYCKPLNYCWEI